eukprot:3858722-Amphidinium_carterae.1
MGQELLKIGSKWASIPFLIHVLPHGFLSTTHIWSPPFCWTRLQVIARMDDSFDVFRSVMYLSPLSVLVSGAH